ncbi:MAG: hypothetical protein ACT6S0_01540 [Roseateles sp.]|uniref:hypothetical protein n=1 Tax=Roseateles sp. TaxID=1971397 RepID=UPI0040366A01
MIATLIMIVINSSTVAKPRLSRVPSFMRLEVFMIAHPVELKPPRLHLKVTPWTLVTFGMNVMLVTTSRLGIWRHDNAKELRHEAAGWAGPLPPGHAAK